MRNSWGNKFCKNIISFDFMITEMKIKYIFIIVFVPNNVCYLMIVKEISYSFNLINLKRYFLVLFIFCISREKNIFYIIFVYNNSLHTKWIFKIMIWYFILDIDIQKESTKFEVIFISQIFDISLLKWIFFW